MRENQEFPVDFVGTNAGLTNSTQTNSYSSHATRLLYVYYTDVLYYILDKIHTEFSTRKINHFTKYMFDCRWVIDHRLWNQAKYGHCAHLDRSSSASENLLPVWYTGTRVFTVKVLDKYGGLWLSLRDSTARQATEVSIFSPKPLYISSIPQGGPPQKGRKKQDFFSGIRNLYDLHRINSKMTKTISFVFNFLKDQNTFNI